MKNKIIEAILKLNPTAQVSVSGDDINTLVWENGTQSISIADIQSQIPIVEQEIANEEANKIANKQSAISKLKALGLNDTEIKAIIGI
jgi:hypothetical protein